MPRRAKVECIEVMRFLISTAAPALISIAALALLATPALADGIVDNVNGITVADGGRVIHFKAILIDKDGKVTRLVPPGEEAPKLSRKELKRTPASRSTTGGSTWAARPCCRASLMRMAM